MYKAHTFSSKASNERTLVAVKTLKGKCLYDFSMFGIIMCSWNSCNLVTVCTLVLLLNNVHDTYFPRHIH